MSERMRLICAISLIAAIGMGAFVSLRALAAGGERSMSESGLTIPAQSTQSSPQSEPVTPATTEPSSAPEHSPEPAPEPTQDAAPPAPAPVPSSPHYVAPSGPQRAVPDDDDDDDDDKDDDDNDKDDADD
ncbi:hypothetical protein [Schaalia odontolytica]|uniref:Uncharacterized protein n=1 Tax=Schaalia odontolytica TaxID=1660 RepID=A0A2X0VLF3_9ACTO|nr:hypothetical protein [Schaalia odontolytica]WMS27723.1 hypothetical protein RDV55_01400 [Schaalia odontolytica]SPT54742.1 Uncharacterised protein [Schaalia odontolytica]